LPQDFAELSNHPRPTHRPTAGIGELADFGVDEAERFAAEIEATPHLFTPASLNATPMGQALLTGAGAGWGAVVDIPPTLAADA
jgi:hypothetical protein